MSLEPTASATTEIVVKRSRFIATASPAASVGAAEATIHRRREEHADASHVVYAFLVGDEASEHAGMSDAGEPRGTAGRPVMDVLRGSGVRDVVLTVVRYFGGTKLGTGGLVHAYSDAAKTALAALPTRERIARVRVSTETSYELYERAKLAVGEAGGAILEESFGTGVRLVWELPESALEPLRVRLSDLSRGAMDLEVVR